MHADMAYVPMNRVRALVIVHEPAAYAPTRVRDAANYLLTSSSATEDEQRLANDAIEWLRSKRGEPQKAPVQPEVSSSQPANKPKRGRNAAARRARSE